ncbi:MAG: ACT domain-containing protein, partial [Myxococcota bacterium]
MLLPSSFGGWIASVICLSRFDLATLSRTRNLEIGRFPLKSLVLTLIGSDRSGLIEILSNVIASHQGNWVESRMAHLSGQFAGLLRV